MLEPGHVVTTEFAGATASKRRPAVVISSQLYHTHRPDVILGVLTSRIAAATTPTDYVLHDWQEAGLRLPTAFRAYFGMAEQSVVHVIGRLSERDWREVQACVGRAVAVSLPLS